VTPTETGKGYDTIATRWVSEEFPDANGIQQHERAISFVQETHFALDVGCGANTRLIDLFEKHGFQVDGVDVSREMIQLAKLRKPEVQYYLADICTWELPRRYDLISAWDSIWHVPLGEQERVLRKLIHGLTGC
jgi:trans-aconitate methyltransferase